MFNLTDRVGAIIICRLKSLRLPRKALLHIGGQTVLHRCLSQCRESILVGENVILATSTNSQDDELVASFTRLKDLDKNLASTKIFRGSEDNVVNRLIVAAELHNIKHIVRVTGDSPFVSSELMDLLITHHMETDSDYTALNNYALGLQSEVISLSSLKKLSRLLDVSNSEFLTLYYKHNPSIFKTSYIECPYEFVEEIRFNLDYPEDYVFLNEVHYAAYGLSNLHKTVHIKELVDCVKKNPELVNLNQHKQRAYQDIDVQEFIIRGS